MSTGQQNAPADPHAEPLADFGKAAVMVPLIIGGAIIAAVIILWHTHTRKAQLSEMARVEEMARQELRAAYVEMRALRPNVALTRAAKAGELMKSLKTEFAPDYAQMRIALYLLEGESLFMKDCAQHAGVAEEKFTRALGLMPYASGDMWQFGMLGRARARFELKKYEEAASELGSVLDRNRSFGAAYYWRSLAREQLGDLQGARDDEQQARALDSWPPLRDFMQASCVWTRDILSKQHFCGEGAEDGKTLAPFFLPPVDEEILDDTEPAGAN